LPAAVRGRVARGDRKRVEVCYAYQIAAVRRGRIGRSGRAIDARTARPTVAQTRVRAARAERVLDRQQRSRGLRRDGSAKGAEKDSAGSRAIAGVGQQLVMSLDYGVEAMTNYGM
jgi:hypothetical protein